MPPPSRPLSVSQNRLRPTMPHKTSDRREPFEYGQCPGLVSITALFCDSRVCRRQVGHYRFHKIDCGLLCPTKHQIGGSLLNMGSVLGWSPSPRFFATHAYAAAKSATIGFTKSIAAYYAPQNIRSEGAF